MTHEMLNGRRYQASTLTVARHGYTCRQTTTLGHDGDGRLSSHVRLAAQHVDADGATRKGCGVDTTDYPTFAAHMREAHGVKAKPVSRTFGAPPSTGCSRFAPVRLSQLEREWLGVDITWTWDTEAAPTFTGQVWALAPTGRGVPGQVWIAGDDGEFYCEPVAWLTRVEPASVDVELPIAS